MGFIKEFFYLRKSDRKVILTLLGVIVIGLGVIFLTGGKRPCDATLSIASHIANKPRPFISVRKWSTVIQLTVVVRP